MFIFWLLFISTTILLKTIWITSFKLSYQISKKNLNCTSWSSNIWFTKIIKALKTLYVMTSMIVVRNNFQKKQTNISYFIIRQIIHNFDVLNENQFSIFYETIHEWFFTMFDYFENSKFIWTSKFARRSNSLNIYINTFSKK